MSTAEDMLLEKPSQLSFVTEEIVDARDYGIYEDALLV